MGEKIARAVLEISGDSGALLNEFEKIKAGGKSLAGTFDGIGKQLSSVGDRVLSTGKMISAAVSAPLLAVGAAALAAGQDIDDAYDQIRIGTGKVGDELEDLQESFDNVFADVPSSAEDVSRALVHINKTLGLSGQPLEDLTKQVLTFARITKTDLGEALPQVTNLFGQWKVATKDQASTLDFLFRASQQTGVSVSSLMSRVQQVGPAFRALGFDLQTSVALLGSWEKEGLNVDALLAGLQASARKFADANIPLAEGLKQTVARMQEYGDGPKAMALANDVFGKSAVTMADAIFKGKLNVDQLLGSIRDGKDTIAAAAKDTDGFAESWKKFKNGIELALKPLGLQLVQILDNLKPKMETIVGLASSLSDKFASLSPNTQSAVIGLGAIAVAAGPAVIGLGSFLHYGKEVLHTLPAIGSGYARAAAPIATFGANLANAAGPIGSAGSLLAKMPPTVGALGGALARFVPILGLATLGFMAANEQLERHRAAQDGILAKNARAQQLLEAWQKTFPGANAKLADFYKYSDEAAKQLLAMAAGAAETHGPLQGVSLDLDQARKAFENAKAGGASLLDQLDKNSPIAKFREDVADLATRITRLGDDALEELGDDAQKAERQARQLGITLESLPKAVRNLAAAADRRLWANALADFSADARKLQKEQLEASVKDLRDALGKELAARGAALADINEAEREASDLSAERTLDDLDFKRRAVEQWAADQKKAFKGNEQETLTYFALIDSITEQKLDEILFEWLKHNREVSADNQKTAGLVTRTWQENLGEIAALFAQLAQATRGSLSQVASGIGSALNAITALSKSVDVMGSGGWRNFLSGATGAAGALSQLATLAISFGKALHDALTVSEEEKIVKDLRKELGLALDEADPLVKKIKQLEGRGGFGGKRPKGERLNRGEAENLVLPDLLEKAGGLNSKNYQQFADRTYDLLMFLQQQGPRAGEALEPLNAMLGKIGDYELSQTGMFSPRLLQNFRELRDSGTQLAEVNRLMAGQMDRTAAAIERVVGGLSSRLAPAGAKLTKLQEELDGLQERGDLAGDELARVAQLQGDIAALKSETLATSQAEFDRLSRLTFATINQQMALGKSAAEAIGANGPAVDALIAGFEQFGFAGSAAFDQLKRMRDLAVDNAGVLAQAGALNELAQGYVNLGGDSAEVFADLQAQGKATYDTLIAAGFTQKEALREIAPLLGTLRTLHEEQNVAIDEGTQALIDQAREAGVLKDKTKTDAELMRDAMKDAGKEIAKAIREAFGIAKQESDDAVNHVRRGWGGLSFRVPVQYETSGGGPGAPETPAPTIGGGFGFARGTPRFDFMSFRRAGQPVTVHGDEAIVPRGGGHGLAGEIASVLGPLLSRPGVAIFNVNGREFMRATMQDAAHVYQSGQYTRAR